MRGGSIFHLGEIAQATRGVWGSMGRTRMCWKCQQDKPCRGGRGKITQFGHGAGKIMRFVCADCMEKK